LPTCCEVPSNLIISIIVCVEVLKFDPKFGELLHVSEREVLGNGIFSIHALPSKAMLVLHFFFLSTPHKCVGRYPLVYPHQATGHLKKGSSFHSKLKWWWVAA
jgi:hypothetical protein